MSALFGIDLGGTKIEGAVVDSERPDHALCRVRLPTEAARGYEHIVGRMVQVVEQMEKESGLRRPAAIGFGIPGAIDPVTGQTNLLGGHPLGRDLTAVLGVQAMLANDANCFALAEARFGAARGRGVVLGLIIGTGVGSGIVVDGRVLAGCHGIAGEWAHNPLRGEDTPCSCGRRGCIEAVISGPALARHYRAQGGQAARLPDIVERAGAGEAAARATLNRLRDKFAEAIAVVMNILDPDAIVIGGGVGNIDLLYGPETRAAVRMHFLKPDLRTEFLRPALGDSAGVFGAAMLTLGSNGSG